MRVLEYLKIKYHAYIFKLINDFMFYFREIKTKIQISASLFLLSIILTKIHLFCLE